MDIGYKLPQYLSKHNYLFSRLDRMEGWGRSEVGWQSMVQSAQDRSAHHPWPCNISCIRHILLCMPFFEKLLCGAMTWQVVMTWKWYQLYYYFRYSDILPPRHGHRSPALAPIRLCFYCFSLKFSKCPGRVCLKSGIDIQFRMLKVRNLNTGILLILYKLLTFWKHHY